MNLGERVHLLRRRLGWTQVALAQVSGINANTIARIERSEVRDPGGKLIARLAEAMGTKTDYLLGLTEDSGVESDMEPATADVRERSPAVAVSEMHAASHLSTV